MVRIHRLTLLEALRRAGLPGLAGALLIAFAVAWTLFALSPARDARENARAALARGEARLAAAQRGELQPAAAPAGPLEALRERLTAQPAATTDIERLYAAAEAEDLSLARGEYALVIEAEGGLARYQILLPVRGDYPQLRRFLGSALAAVPALGLEDLALQRKQVSETALEGQLRLTLYLSRRR